MADIVYTPGVNVTIEIDTKDLPLSIDSQELARRIAKQSIKEAQTFWHSEAGRRLNTSRQRYQEAIQIDLNDDAPAVYLQHPNPRINKFILNLEIGIDKLDMKPALLKGKDKRVIPLWADAHHAGRQVQFVTVSTKSDPKSWLWPKSYRSKVRRGVNIHNTVIKQLDRNIIRRVANEVLRDLKV